MKSCSCIFARQRDGEEAILFEGNHPIPFFWLMLLNQEDIETYRKKMVQYTNEENTRKDTSLGLDKIKAISQAANRRDYVKKHLITCLPLFDDWLYFMQIADFSDMKIYIDLYIISLNHSNLNHFCDSMLRAINCFDEMKETWYEVTIPATCGYEGKNNNKKRFNVLSKAYQELNKKDIYGRFDKKLHFKKKISIAKKTGLFVAILLIIIALVAGLKFLGLLPQI